MSGSPSPRRLVLAFLVAPLVAPATYVIGTLAVGPARGWKLSTSGAWDLVTAAFLVGGACAYAATLIVGVPTYFMLRRLGLLGRWTVLLGGAAIGAVAGLVLDPRLHGELFSIPFPWWVGALLGVASAELFWRVRSAPSIGESR